MTVLEKVWQEKAGKSVLCKHPFQTGQPLVHNEKTYLYQPAAHAFILPSGRKTIQTSGG
jgi:hypothetical protein